LEKKSILFPNQHGYRTKKSTVTALTNVILHVYEAFDNKEYTQVAFCDLSKAFDSVNHSILLQKLWKLGIRGVPHELMASYLSDREQSVYWCGQISEWRPIKQGVPQGSVLGPVLFLVYMNDFPDNVETRLTCLFADDTTLLNSNKDIDTLNNKTTISLKQAEKWFSCNKLRMNAEKTEVMTLYSTKNERVPSKTTTFLGVTFTETLDWNEHIAKLRSKLNTAIYCIKKHNKTCDT